MAVWNLRINKAFVLMPPDNKVQKSRQEMFIYCIFWICLYSENKSEDFINEWNQYNPGLKELIDSQLVLYYFRLFGYHLYSTKILFHLFVITYFDEVLIYWTSLKLDSLLGTPVASTALHVASISHKTRVIRESGWFDCINNPDQTAHVPETSDSSVHLWYFQGHKELQMLSPIIHYGRMSFTEPKK